jgi:hypothetical protein
LTAGSGDEPSLIWPAKFPLNVTVPSGQDLNSGGTSTQGVKAKERLTTNGHPAGTGATRSAREGECLRLRECPKTCGKQCFLAPITAQSLEMLSSLMDERRIETLEIY